ncbi:MAG: DegT/DnrJ/EryC1/StrS family aminotransferase [Chitinophagales bacterium]
MTILDSIQMVDLKGQYQGIRQEVEKNMHEVLQSCAFINGSFVKKFAAELSIYLDVKHTIPCANGTDALQIALMALGLKAGDEVITPAFTYVATAEVIALLGLKPVFVDVNADTFTIDLEDLQRKITARTKCIIPVHLYGQVADIQAIMNVAKKNNLFVVEDNAQAIGASYRFEDGTQRKAGGFGHIACTSFYPSKNLGCFGDGGAIFTQDDELASRIRKIANHGQNSLYEFEMIGVNSRLDSLQAAVLLPKLARLDTYNKARQQAAHFYDKAFKNCEKIIIPKRAVYSTHVFHQYTIKLKEKRDELRTFLRAAGVPSMVYYPLPIHLQKGYQQFGYEKGSLPVSEKLCEQVISLPMHTELTKEQLAYICEKVLMFVENN